MVAYVLVNGSSHIFDPAVGGGVFFRAAKKWGHAHQKAITLLGCEVDPTVVEEALASGLTSKDLAEIDLTDFVRTPPPGPYKAIVANPPYIRHHRLCAETKRYLREFTLRLLGKPLDGRSGYHIFFLLQALRLLDRCGRLAFIIPADSFEGIFSTPLWRWITDAYRLDAVITFPADATPFPGVDTNPVVVLIRRETPTTQYLWVRCKRRRTRELHDWITGDLRDHREDVQVIAQDIEVGLRWGLAREPVPAQETAMTLGNFAVVMRGIASGANEFFFLTRDRARELQIPDDFLKRAVGRTRDVTTDIFDEQTLKHLEKKDRPTFLFCPDSRPLAEFPSPVQAYLQEAERQGLPQRPLIQQRRPWYKMETRTPPPILFAYLGRRNSRFIRNLAGVVPLTGFLCVYPRRADREFVDRLWSALSDAAVINNLVRVGKTYGDGAIKVEPRALERLPLPEEVVRKYGLAEELCIQANLTL